LLLARRGAGRESARREEMLRFEFIAQPDWPMLAWLARCEASAPVQIFHGNGIEVTFDWFCEAVWAGDYASGDFDCTDIVAGSGGRLRSNAVIFVSAGSTVDRLQWLRTGSTTWVSNSLACLAAATGAAPDPSYPHYYKDSVSIIDGLDRYKRTLSTSAGEIMLTYFDNLRWDGSQLEAVPKPFERRDFSTFARYRDFLVGCLARVIANMREPKRQFGLRMLGTLSSGYDSTAIATLARPLGLDEVMSFQSARGGDQDSGEAAAQVLRMKLHRVAREAWREGHMAEVPFIASYSSAEDVVFRGAEPLLTGRVLLTGYHGDKAWDKHTKNLSDQIVRGDPSGLALTEYRLWTGFINCAVPFWGVRQIRDLHALSNSEELRPWDVSGGYSRPICRRIAEEAGIPRQAFGVRKRAVSANPFAGWDLLHGERQILTPASLADYLSWISSNRLAWVKRGRIPPIASSELNFQLNAMHMRWCDLMNSSARIPLLWRLVDGRMYRPQYLNCYLFPWSLHRAISRYKGNADTGMAPHGRRSPVSVAIAATGSHAGQQDRCSPVASSMFSVTRHAQQFQDL
jgi:hypothetical protein